MLKSQVQPPKLHASMSPHLQPCAVLSLPAACTPASPGFAGSSLTAVRAGFVSCRPGVEPAGMAPLRPPHRQLRLAVRGTAPRAPGPFGSPPETPLPWGTSVILCQTLCSSLQGTSQTPSVPYKWPFRSPPAGT